MTASYGDFVDDQSIPDDALLYRRVDWDKVGGRSRTLTGQEARINSNCFADYPAAKAMELGYPGPCMSVGLSTVMEELQVPPTIMLDGYEGYGLTVTRVGDLRYLKKGNGDSGPQGVLKSPTEREPWHCVVFDVFERPRKEACKKAIAKVSLWQVALVG